MDARRDRHHPLDGGLSSGGSSAAFDHSVRSALIGDKAAARIAGIIAAKNAHTARAPHAIESAKGSQNVTP
jgi:hypothetical protein